MAQHPRQSALLNLRATAEDAIPEIFSKLVSAFILPNILVVHRFSLFFFENH